jgi:hypothetical protein
MAMGRPFGSRSRKSAAPITPGEMPEGTKEEMEEAWNLTETYTYNILSYLGRDKDGLTKEEFDKERRLVKFLKLGPRAHYLVGEMRSKLTSADVMYILLSTRPSTELSAQTGISKTTIKDLRAGRLNEWLWEYHFIKRVKTHCKSEIYERPGAQTVRKRVKGRKEPVELMRIYRIERLQEDGSFKTLMYTSGIRRAKQMRKVLLGDLIFNAWERDGLLDIRCPIVKIDLN